MTALESALGLPPEPPGEEEARAQEVLDGLRLCLYDDYSLSSIPAPEPLIDGWLAMDTLAWLYGERGHCKSFVALDMAACVANGLDWHGHPVKQVPVLYAALEGGGGIYGRIRAWAAYYGQDRTGIDFLVPRPPLQIVHHSGALSALARERGAGLIIIDTQNRATVGLDENSNVDMGRMIAALDRLRDDTGACVLVVHHAGIGSHRPRGHGSIDGAATTMIRVARDGRLVKIANDKQREGEQSRSMIMALTNHDMGVVLVPSNAYAAATDSESRIIACLRDLVAVKDRVTHGDLKRAATGLGMPDSTFSWALRKLIETGMVMRNGSGYTLANPDQPRL